MAKTIESTFKLKRFVINIERCNGIDNNDSKQEKSAQQNDEITLRRSGRNKTFKKTEQNEPIIIPTQKVAQIITPTQMSNIMWRELTTKNFELKIGMIVCGKMATYWPWPSQIVSFNKKKAVLKFFGDFRKGSVDKANCVPFYHCHSVVLNYIRTIPKEHLEKWLNELDVDMNPEKRKNMPIRQLFLQSIKDVEITLGITWSIFNSLK